MMTVTPFPFLLPLCISFSPEYTGPRGRSERLYPAEVDVVLAEVDVVVAEVDVKISLLA
jgi:hypothetical protein